MVTSYDFNAQRTKIEITSISIGSSRNIFNRIKSLKDYLTFKSACKWTSERRKDNKEEKKE